MKKDETLVDGLEEGAIEATTEATETAAKARKEQTPEEKSTLVAGAEKLKQLGVSPRLASVLALATEWNTPKDVVAVAKEALIKEFGTSEDLKNYIDGDFQAEIVPWQGIAKLLPVLNNIKAFYARRENSGSKKVKYVQASIGGTIYNVNAAYVAEIAGLPAAERKELLLSHPDTNSVDVIEEIL